MSNTIYPSILKLQSGGLALAIKEGCGIALTSYKDEYEQTLIGNYYTDFDFKTSTNITREYLEGKCVKIISPEHGEFMQKLAFNNGLGWKSTGEFDFLSIKEGYIHFRSDGILYKHTASLSEQITIPLPPKAEPDYHIFKDGEVPITPLELCEPKPKEWPQVGDDISLRYKFDSKQIMHTGEALYLSSEHVIIKNTHGNEYHCLACDWSIEKPKTEAEILRDWVQERVGYGIASGFDCEQITHDLFHHCNITKKPQ